MDGTQEQLLAGEIDQLLSAVSHYNTSSSFVVPYAKPCKVAVLLQQKMSHTKSKQFVAKLVRAVLKE